MKTVDHKYLEEKLETKPEEEQSDWGKFVKAIFESLIMLAFIGLAVYDLFRLVSYLVMPIE